MPKDMVNGFPRRKVGGKITPRIAALDEIEDGIQDAPPVCGRASASGRFGEHLFEKIPLRVGEA